VAVGLPSDDKFEVLIDNEIIESVSWPNKYTMDEFITKKIDLTDYRNSITWKPNSH